MSETSLFFGLASHRLRARCKWAGITLLLTPLVPYEVIDNKPQFLWQLIGELSVAGAIAALAPMLAGAAILAAATFTRRATSLAVAVLAILTSAAAIFRLGADATAWDVLHLPDTLIEHPASAILGLALVAAGANLAWKPACRPFARRMLGAGLALITLYYVLPARGQAPIAAAARLAAAIITSPYLRLKLGFLFLTAIALAPAIIAVAGFRLAFKPPTQEKPLIGAFAIYGLPAIMIALLYRSFFGGSVSAEILGAAGAAFFLAALLAILASSFEVLGEAHITPEADLAQPEGLSLRHAIAAAIGASIVVCGAQAALARPPAKGVDWSLSAPTTDGDKLFGEIVPAWNEARERWDALAQAAERPRPRGEAPAPRPPSDEIAKSEAAALEDASRAMIDAAGAINPGLGAAFTRLASEAKDLHVAGRRFYRLIHEINEASRRASLPYYLDPTIGIGQTGDGIIRRFQVLAYRIERVHGFTVDGNPYATLHVRAIGERRVGHQRLGFSRDMQPFALVVLDETEPFARALAQGARAETPTCGAVRSPEVQRALDQCGEVLAAIDSSVRGAKTTEGSPGEATDLDSLEPGLVALTERHELQHQIDGPHLPIPEAVERHMPTQSDEMKARVSRELSSYIAEITAKDAPPKLGLVHLVRFALMGKSSAEHHVAIIALDVLRGRDVRREGSTDVDAEIDAFLELSREGDDDLRAAAASAWRALFGGSLPTPR